ncbi:MAG: class I SAM-dependent methyltransferase [Lachnospiraceae bacterium]|nr:class I SAM-dependent methyltransferase [Lachnospiraceae bacterium]
MSYCRSKFLNYLSEGASILDAGCGSGRDSVAFKQLGYHVTAMDASPEICKEAEKVLGQKVLCKIFEELDDENVYDGIWACASLLHVPKESMGEVLYRLKLALKDGGILYASFKYGDGEKIVNERLFNYFNEQSLRMLMRENGFEVLELFVTQDVREGRSEEKWLNVVGGDEGT